MGTVDLPVMFEQLNFANFYSAETTERDRFCQNLVSSLRSKGFVRLINHGIPSEDIDRAFNTVRFFLQMVKPRKLKAEMSI